VRGGAKICPVPECPAEGEPCPELEQLEAYWTAENRASQLCVRDYLSQLGGTVQSEFVFINGFQATLTWAQLDQLAAHPHVSGIYGVTELEPG
jgi:hypothetical protein